MRTQAFSQCCQPRGEAVRCTMPAETKSKSIGDAYVRHHLRRLRQLAKHTCQLTQSAVCRTAATVCVCLHVTMWAAPCRMLPMGFESHLCGGSCPGLPPTSPTASRAPRTVASPMSSSTCVITYTMPTAPSTARRTSNASGRMVAPSCGSSHCRVGIQTEHCRLCDHDCTMA